MFIDIRNYIALNRDDRRKHLKLDEPCSEIGGSSGQFRGLLAYHLRTTIPVGRSIHLCHACHNGKCSNVNHLYWGTQSDNSIDIRENGTKTVYQRTRDKYGEEAHDLIVKEYSSKGGLGNKDNVLNPDHKKKISESLKKSWEARRLKS
jgi:hypothetical protein